jgi:hypothetical protein
MNVRVPLTDLSGYDIALLNRYDQIIGFAGGYLLGKFTTERNAQSSILSCGVSIVTLQGTNKELKAMNNSLLRIIEAENKALISNPGINKKKGKSKAD